MEASREAEKEGLKKRTILQNKLLDKAGLKSKSVRGEKKKKKRKLSQLHRIFKLL